MTQYPQVPPQPAGPTREAPGATAGLVLGILSIAMSGPIIGLILGILGYTKSSRAKAICDANPGMYNNGGIAQAGYICSIIGIIVGSVTSLCGCGYFAIVLLALFGAAAGGTAM
jgi:hypothetical protein